MTKSKLEGRKVTFHDMCLRDGMHAKREQISVEQMVQIATALDRANVPMLQVTHGALSPCRIARHQSYYRGCYQSMPVLSKILFSKHRNLF